MSDLLPTPLPTPLSLRAGGPSPPLWTRALWKTPERPCELVVAMAMAALEFDHWGPGVGVGSWYMPCWGQGGGSRSPEVGARNPKPLQFPHL